MLTGREEKADIMIHNFRKALRNIRTLAHTVPPAKRKRVYFESVHRKMKTFTPGSIQMFVLTMAGGINLANDTRAVEKSNIAVYGKDQILSLADEIDVYLAQKGKMNRTSVKKICQESGFDNIRAVRNDQIFVIEEHLVSRPTRRLIRGAVKIGNFLYPEIYTQGVWGGLARILSAPNPLPAISGL